MKEKQVANSTIFCRANEARVEIHSGGGDLCDPPGDGSQRVAFEYIEQALALFQEVGDTLRESILLQHLGGYLLDMGELKRGRALLRQALKMAYKLGSKLEMGHTFLALSRAEEQMDNFTSAAQFLSFAARLYSDCGAQVDLSYLEKVDMDRLQAHFDRSSLEAVLTPAATWTLSEAMILALAEDDGMI